VFCVNDGAVMQAWAKDQGIEGSNITFLGDPKCAPPPPHKWLISFCDDRYLVTCYRPGRTYRGKPRGRGSIGHKACSPSYTPYGRVCLKLSTTPTGSLHLIPRGLPAFQANASRGPTQLVQLRLPSPQH
jgi:hypothetical protein